MDGCRQTEEDRKEVPGIQELARRAANWACANLEECREMNPNELVQAQVLRLETLKPCSDSIVCHNW
jgi:hypothetical protein